MDPYFSDKVPALISCFSLKYDNLLMWSHYADGHRGFCQIFICNKIKNSLFIEIVNTSFSRKLDKMVIQNNMLPLFPVIYNTKKKEPILTSSLSDAKGNNVKLMNAFQKADVWKYEKEHRAIVFDNCLVNDNKVYYPDKILFGIILGSEMDNESKKLMELICKTKNIHLYQMNKSFNKYELKLEFIF